ncbi:MAG TPA: PDZ domain-containing protein, partial [Longimicrobiales bacterium]|nr:PDZ domain-containing protein [Longimicrobiales bacterium]
MSDASRRRTWFLIAAALIAVWGLLGLIDQPNQPFSGYQTDGDNTIVLVRPGSPAEAAGLQVGDHITSIGGISVEDSRALAERPRPDIGETRTLVVDRDGTSVDVDLTYSEVIGNQRTLGYVAVLLGFVFLVFGLLPYLKAPTRPAELLAMTGLGLSLAFFTGPYFASYGLRTAFASLTLVAIIFGFAFLMDLMVTYPRPKGWRSASWAPWVVYGPAALVSAVIVYVIVASPAATSGLNVAINTMFGLFIVYYFGAAMVAMVHSWARATPAEREAYGLTTVLVGVLVGLLPVTLGSLVGIFSPETVLPGSDYYFVLLGLIPITLWAALSRSGGGYVAPHAAPVAAPAPEAAASPPEAAAPPPPPPPPETDPYEP